MISYHANCQKFNESIEWYLMFPPNWGWEVGKRVLMNCCESIKWGSFQDSLKVSSKFIMHGTTLQDLVWNLHWGSIYAISPRLFIWFSMQYFFPIILESILGPFSILPFPDAIPVFRSIRINFFFLFPHLELSINGAYSIYTCSCFTMLCYFLLCS